MVTGCIWSFYMRFVWCRRKKQKFRVKFTNMWWRDWRRMKLVLAGGVREDLGTVGEGFYKFPN